MITEDVSGIAEDHIGVIQQFCMDKECIVMIRPVNIKATKLIKEGYGTKGLDIHGKSSDWGPMAGFIPYDQNLSKNVGKSDAVKKGNIANNDSLNSAHVKKIPLKLTKTLVKAAIEGKEEVEDLTKSHVIKLNEISFEISPEDINQDVDDKDARWKVTYDNNKPLEVMGYHDTAVTADYDLFALMTKPNNATEIEPIERTDFGVLGTMTKAQKSLIEELNSNLKARYGQDVINHGTECDNPYPESDGTIAVFLPNGTCFMVVAVGAAARISWLFGGAAGLGWIGYPNDKWWGGSSGRPDETAMLAKWHELITYIGSLAPEKDLKNTPPSEFLDWFYIKAKEERNELAEQLAAARIKLNEGSENTGNEPCIKSYNRNDVFNASTKLENIGITRIKNDCGKEALTTKEFVPTGIGSYGPKTK